MSKNKIFNSVLSITLALSVLTGCGGEIFNMSSEISVVSREEGSGTRGAFIELFGIEHDKIDYTTQNAEINDSTGIMLTNVSGNPNAIGYVSLGALNDTVKALKIDGAVASSDNIKNGTYKISRPFNITVKEGLSEVSQDFINFILSTEGQAVVENNGYIAIDNVSAYNGVKPFGRIVIAGSSSVTPIMEKLKESYIAINSNAEIEIQQNDSSSGIKSTIENICDIGMASRELKESELSQGLTSLQIAIDGIAVIVNNANTIDNMTKEQVMKIYTGEALSWNDIEK